MCVSVGQSDSDGLLCAATASLPPEVAACHVCCQDNASSSCDALGRNRSTGFSCQYVDSGELVSGMCEEVSHTLTDTLLCPQSPTVICRVCASFLLTSSVWLSKTLALLRPLVDSLPPTLLAQSPSSCFLCSSSPALHCTSW